MSPLVKRVRDVGQAAGPARHHINYGGCGVYALLLGRELRKLGCAVRYRFATSTPLRETSWNMTLADSLVANEGVVHAAERLPWNHVLVQWRSPKGRRWWLSDSVNTAPDSEGYLPSNGMRWHLVGGVLSEEHLAELVGPLDQSPPRWNRKFKRETGVPAIMTAVSALTADMSVVTPNPEALTPGV